MIDPILLILPRLVLRMPSIVHGQRFRRGTIEYTLDGDGNTLRRHGWPPPFSQETQTNVAIGIHVFVLRRRWQKVIGK